jgi:hypothetical protein
MSTMLPDDQALERSVRRGARRVGYVVAAAVNLVLLWMVHQLLDWGWPSFLTPDFEELLPIISVSLAASVVANLVYVWDDRAVIKNLGDLVTSLIGLVGAVWTYRVFPFDLSDGWAGLARVVIVVGIIGTSIGALVALVKLARGPEPDHGAR